MKRILLYLAGLWILCSMAGSANADDEVVKIEIFIKEHKFTPDVIEAPAGRKIELTVYNQDKTAEEFESPDLKREKLIPGNAKIKIILAPLRAGEYKFFGEFFSETAQGKLIVKELTNLESGVNE